MRRWIFYLGLIVFLVIVILTGTTGATLAASDDHPSSYPNGTSVSVDSSTAGNIETQGDRDFFKYNGQENSTYRARVILGTLRLGFVRVYNAGGSVVAESDSGDASWTAASTQLFYIDVWGSGTGTYQMRLTGSSPSPTPSASWEQSNVSISPSSLSSNGGTVTVDIATDESNLTISPITFSISGSNYSDRHSANQVGLADHSTYVSRGWQTTFDIPANTTTSSSTYTVTASSSQINGTRTGSLTVQGQPQTPSDDHPSSYPNGTSVSVDSSTAGNIETQGDRDFFKFNGQANSTYRARVILGTLRLGFVRVYNAGGSVVAESDSGDASWTAASTQLFYIDVWGSGTGTYQMRLTGSSPSPIPTAYILLQNTRLTNRSQSSASVVIDHTNSIISSGDVEITFDPLAFEILDIMTGNLLGPEAVVGIKTLDNVNGRIRFAAARKDVGAAVTRDSFANLQIRVKPGATAGVYTFSITRIGLADETFRDIAGIRVEPAVVTVANSGNIQADINGDNIVDYRDLAILGAAYGSIRGDNAYKSAADLNSDDTVDYKDLAILGVNYGK
jgi:hypothetical protein